MRVGTVKTVLGVTIGIPVLAESVLVARALHGDDAEVRNPAPTASYPEPTWNPALTQLVDGAKAIASVVASKIDPPDQLSTHSIGGDHAPVHDAAAAWSALEAHAQVRSEPGLFHAQPGAPYHASVWAMSQVLNAAIDLAGRSGDWSNVAAITRRMSSMYGDGAWSDGLPLVPRSWSIGAHPFYDDNAWVALDLLQAYRGTGDRSWLARVEQLVPFFESGIREDGGVLWGADEASPSVNTCSAAPVGQVFAQLYAATGDRKYLDTALKIERYLVRHLRQDDGLYADNIDLASGEVETRLHTYNQGSALGLQLELYRATGDRTFLDRAQHTAQAATRWLADDDALWQQPPSFNAIFFRNLLALDQVAPDPSARALLTKYVARAKRDGLDSETGLYTAGGIAQYGPRGNVLDQAGMIQMLALAEGADPDR